MLDALTLDQLRVFLAIVETGSFSAASRRLERAQSAVSHAIRALETTLDVTLFDRSGWTPTLTEVGRALLADARVLVGSAAALRLRARSFSEGIEPELALAVDPLLPLSLLTQGLRQLQAAYPALTIRLETDCIGGPERRLRAGEVSLAVCSLEMTGAADLLARHLLDVRMLAVAAPDHPLAAWRGPIPRAALQEQTQLVLNNAAPSAWSRGVVSPKTWRFIDPHTRVRFLLAGFGWCHISDHEAAPFLAQGSLVPLSLAESRGFDLPIHIVQRPDQPPGRVATALVDLLETAAAAYRARA